MFLQRTSSIFGGDLPTKGQKAHTWHTDRRGWRDSNRPGAGHGRARTCRSWALPGGLPTFAIPWITYADIVPVLIGGSGFHTHLGRSPQLSRRAASGHDGLKAFR